MIKIVILLTLAVLFSLRKLPRLFPMLLHRVYPQPFPMCPHRQNRPSASLGNVRPTKSELDSRAIELKEMLLQLHTPKYPFRLAVSDRHTKRRLGTYFPAKSRIVVYARNRMGMQDTAIHEYAHHVTDTEIGHFPRCHGKMFKRTYSQLIDIYNSTHQPQIVPDRRYYIRNVESAF